MTGLLAILYVPAVAAAFAFQAPTGWLGLAAFGVGVALLVPLQWAKAALRPRRRM
jgi:hypothetical protein